MAAENVLERPLFGGAVSTVFSTRFQDLSMFREVPDHQEAFADPSRDESLIFELLELKSEVEDAGSAAWFLRDLAREQDAQDSIVLEHSSGVEEVVILRCKNIPTVLTTAIGQMAISKDAQGREAQNIVRVYLANLRLKGVGTDLLITAYEPILIKEKTISVKKDELHAIHVGHIYMKSPLSESARTVGAGLAVPAVQSGCLPIADVFRTAVSSFKIGDWSLFDSGA